MTFRHGLGVTYQKEVPRTALLHVTGFVLRENHLSFQTRLAQTRPLTI